MRVHFFLVIIFSKTRKKWGGVVSVAEVGLNFSSSLFVQGNINCYDPAAAVHIFPFLKEVKTVYGHICGNRV